MLVNDHVDSYNKNRARNYQHSDSICVDESIPRWYSIRGDWINYGFPQYIAIDKNPENGCETQNSADGFSGIMIQSKLVKNSYEEDLHYTEEHDGLLHGTKVMLNFLYPWLNKQRCVVIADSYFASVQACEELKKCGLRFIGVVKTATRGFCMEKLSEIKLSWIGMRKE